MKDKRAFLKENVYRIAQYQHGGLSEKLNEKTDSQKTNLVDFSTRLNPLGNVFHYSNTGLDLNKLINKAKDQIGNYPDNRYLELRTAAAGFLGKGLTSDNIVPGNGVCELIRLVLACSLEKDDIVLVPFPSSAEYTRHSILFGARVIPLPPHELLLVEDDVLSSARMVLLCNPGNPGGRIIPRKELRIFAKRCMEHKTLLVVDESCIELCDHSQTLTGLTFDNNYLVVIRSLAHAFAIPGLNVAYGITSEEMASFFNNVRLPWSIGAFSDIMGTAVLGMEGGVNCKYLHDSRLAVQAQRNYLISRVGRIYGFSPLPSDANYVLVDLKDLFIDSHALVENLKSKGFAIRDCSSFFQAGKQFVRIGLRTQEENDVLVKTIGEVLTETSKEDARGRLEVTIESAAAGAASASRGTCQYYPCHFEGQDCTFCFCPFYACEDERTGGKWITGSSGNKVWSCENCTYIHQSRLSRQILDTLMEDGDTEENIKKAWDKIIKSLL